MIEAVFFDLDGTLKVSVPSGMAMFLEYATQLGIEIDDAAAAGSARWNHWYWAQSPALLEDLALGDEEALWTRYTQRLLGAVGVADPTEAQARAITERFAEYAPRSELNEGARETLTGLGAAGYSLGLVSNRRQPLDEIVSELGLEGMFAFTLAAGEIDIWKPDPGIFREALRRGGCQSDGTAYVGDNYYADVVSSQSAGLTPVLLDPKEVFPDAECRVIHKLSELLAWLT